MSDDQKKSETTNEIRQKAEAISRAININDPQAIENFGKEVREVIDKAPDWHIILMDIGASDSSIKSPLEFEEIHQRFLLAMQEEMLTYSSLLHSYILAGEFIKHNLHTLPSAKQLSVHKKMQISDNIHTLDYLYAETYVSLRSIKDSLSASFNQLNDPLLNLSQEQAKKMKKGPENKASRSVAPLLKKTL